MYCFLIDTINLEMSHTMNLKDGFKISILTALSELLQRKFVCEGHTNEALYVI